MAMKWLTRLAARAPVPVYPVIGSQAASEIQDLSQDPRLRFVTSPRHARVLLVAGGISPMFERALRRIHDQVPAPMATVWWRATPPAELVNQAIVIDDYQQIAAGIVDAYRGLLRGDRPGEPHLCPDEPPAPWEGLGDHGQGGEGMMGGIPYGRPMAMTDDDLRDGLELDPLAFSLGPFWPALPPGLVAQITLHGDVVARFKVATAPYPIGLPAVFLRALEHPVPIAELELARARYHMRQLSHALWLNGLQAQSQRLLRQLHTLAPGGSLSRLRNHLRRVGFFASAGGHKGVLSHAQADLLGGPAARAAGIPRDARLQDPHYGKLNFKLTVNHGAHCHARWHQWFDEIEQALNLAAHAQDQRLFTGNTESVETPRGVMYRNSAPDDAAIVLEDLLPGLEWSEAMATIASLDLAAVSDYASDHASEPVANQVSSEGEGRR